jgi:hypothetical protein
MRPSQFTAVAQSGFTPEEALPIIAALGGA